MKKQFIWIIGSPRSGTSFLTDYLCDYVDKCYNEPWQQFDPTNPSKWKFPDVNTTVFKYCLNWSHAKILNHKFPTSYFVHLFRNPAQVVYSMVFPKPDAYPFRNLFDDKTIHGRFKNSIHRWHDFVSGSQIVCKNFKGIEIAYENIEDKIEALAAFLNLPLSKDKLNFKSRNGINVDQKKFDSLERLWQTPEFSIALKKRKEIEALIE